MTQFLHYHPDYQFLPRWRRSAALVFYPRVPISVRYTCRPDQKLSCEGDLFERRGLNIENTIRTITKSASCDFCTMAVSCTCTCGGASYALIAFFILDVIILCSLHFHRIFLLAHQGRQFVQKCLSPAHPKRKEDSFLHLPAITSSHTKMPY